MLIGKVISVERRSASRVIRFQIQSDLGRIRAGYRLDRREKLDLRKGMTVAFCGVLQRDEKIGLMMFVSKIWRRPKMAR